MNKHPRKQLYEVISIGVSICARTRIFFRAFGFFSEFTLNVKEMLKYLTFPETHCIFVSSKTKTKTT